MRSIPHISVMQMALSTGCDQLSEIQRDAFR
jgi:hypothetical protein